MKKLLLFFLTISALYAAGATVKVSPAQAEIVVPPNSSATVRFAAKELQDHLKMVTGKNIPITAQKSNGKYHFIFAKPANVKLKP